MKRSSPRSDSDLAGTQAVRCLPTAASQLVNNGERRQIRMSATENGDLELVTAADLALERFEAALDTYRQALEKAPAEALGQRRPGEEYTLAGLAYHVNAVLDHIRATARAMLDAGLRETSAPDSSNLFEVA